MLAGFADEHVHSGIVAGLRRHGMDVVTVQDRGWTGTDDAILLAAATSEGRLMLTNDQDFLTLNAQWTAAGRHHAGIVFWEQDFPVGRAILLIDDYASNTPPAVAANTVYYL